MSEVPAPILLMTFVIHEDSGRVEIRWPDGETFAIGSRRALATARAELEDMLDTFRRGVPGLVPRLDLVETALRALVRSSDKLVKLLLGDDIALRVGIEQRLAFHRYSAASGDRATPYVEVHGHDDFFPFELLPLFADADEIPEFGNAVDAENVLTRFLGFGAAVRRVRPSRIRQEPLQMTAEGLPVQFVRYNMPGAVSEEMFFEAARERLLVDGPWPEAGTAVPDVVVGLLGALYDPRRRLTGGYFVPVPAQIQHYACHCDTRFADADDYALIMGTGPESSAPKISLRQMYDGVLRLERVQEWPYARPLVFLNACGAGRVNVRDFRSFPNWFLSNGFRGFVGAETEIPDIVAAHYSARFYEELLAGRTLAEAVVRAKVRLWRERGNPLGLLYVFYGDPFLRIASNRSEVSNGLHRVRT